ncbi:hypothetical protein BT69DRAFT_1353702 [Atractiella rhizophila]|nr:hypothetical protein BT69DRAFT_1353702 [Atractiella rhizophila]
MFSRHHLLILSLVASSIEAFASNQWTYSRRFQENTDTSAQLVFSHPSSHDHSHTLIPFSPCVGADILGRVHHVSVSPCRRVAERGLENMALEDPCVFLAGETYNIRVSFTTKRRLKKRDGPKRGWGNPRFSLVARDDTKFPPVHYPYPGQSFDACNYIDCPLEKEETATLSYEFRTLQPAFNHLSLNVTDGLDGPSVLCFGMDAIFAK